MSSDSEHELIAAPLFQPISAPRLKSTDASAIAEFLLARERYEALIEERSSTHKVKSSIEPGTLKVIVKYKLKTTVEAVTDNALKKYLEERVHKVANAGSIDIDSLFREKLVFDMSMEDPVGRFIKLFRDFDQLVDKYGLDKIFDESEDGQKAAVKMIIKALKPAPLKELIIHEFNYNKRSASKSMTVAFAESKLPREILSS